VRAALWERLRSAVLVSATLTVRGSFEYFDRQTGLGADLEPRQEVFPSPFDYRSQAVLVVEHAPEREYSATDAVAYQTQRLRDLTEATGGRLLALFTNKQQMNRVAAALGERAQSDGVVLLAQGVHGSAASLADEFRAHPATVLLGVDALWTGQDFPGDTLVCLVIAKLPFPRQDPLFNARREAAAQDGRDWFRDFYLPEAVLRFRQGFGRLIRTETDRGVVVVLDHRLTQKRYLEDFLRSLPEIDLIRARPQDVVEAATAALRRLGCLA
jgi:ATP-dependent DNA helicase DinG